MGIKKTAMATVITVPNTVTLLGDNPILLKHCATGSTMTAAGFLP
ncbi:hypothetical protein CPTB_02002 [Corynebacterium pseudotuberculosis]|nr:Hypothetical protein Cp3995_1212 [Corynebacterium pseudotuberculosis 3/99-5]AIG07590.1 hypothetical protein CPTA_01761 [Corynebacterium pseudotuberculosis]AIG10058.1 hypothetical protein CPTB_02002 [Corynebacterium pseudotuberculosis]AIG12040.1 hypothetical protein CPTC_01752 [Corynebacterium pseudotuberculosis]AQL51304.1 hypothetical protein CpPA04_1205 [Corynebacterium pseudotuberculosis]